MGQATDTRFSSFKFTDIHHLIMTDVDKIKNRLRGLKAWYTRIETACEPYASGAKAGNKDIYETKRHELTTAKKKSITPLLNYCLPPITKKIQLKKKLTLKR